MVDCKSDTLFLNTDDDWYELWDVGVVVLFQVIDTNNCVLVIDLPGGTPLPQTTYYDGESKTYTEGDYTYVVTVQDISIWSSGAKTVNVKVCRTITTGSIYCSSFPQGATIWLDGVSGYGTTNKVVSDLTPGNYELKFTLAGYEDYTKTVTVEAGYESFVSKDLVPIPTTGTLNCSSTPTGVTITIGTTNYGLTNRDITLAPGTYIVKYTKTGYDDWSKTVIITTGVTSYISHTMVEQCPTPTLTGIIIS